METMVLGNLHFIKVNVDTDKRYLFPHTKKLHLQSMVSSSPENVWKISKKTPLVRLF